MAFLPQIGLGIAALALVVLAVAGPAYRLGASMPTALAIMRWAAYIGGAAALIAIGSVIYSYRGRKWTATILSRAKS